MGREDPSFKVPETFTKYIQINEKEVVRALGLEG